MAKEDDADKQILDRLDLIVKLLGQIVASEHETLETKAVALSNSGLTPTDIAKICGTTAGSISVSLNKAKKKAKRKPKK